MDRLEQWIVDRNHDGYSDDVAVRFVVTDDITDAAFWPRLLDLAARIGLETHALPFPLVVRDATDVPDGADAVVIRTLDEIPALPTDSFAASEACGTNSEPPSGCLTRLFTIDGVLEDRDGDLLPDASRIAFDLPADLPPSLGVALANLAARIGLESGGITFPLVRAGGVPFVVRPGDGPASVRAVDAGWRAEGDADELARLIEHIAATWPHIHAPQTGGAASAVSTLGRWLAGDGPEPNEPGEVVFERGWTGAWEAITLVSQFSELVSYMEADSRPDDDTVNDDQVIFFACEPPEQRQQIAAELRRGLATSKYPDIQVTVLSSFKAGLSWLREVVIPALDGLPVQRVRVMADAYPSDEPGALDLPIRWLQELFPGNELIAAATGLPLDAIEFTVSDDIFATYVAEAFGADDEPLGRWECMVPSMEIPFISALPDSGVVRVTTGGFTWYVDGEMDATILNLTDLDTFWAFWQTEIIPALLERIDEAGGPVAANQPFFGELLAEVWISAPNESIGIREENDSAAEALAEDIYFTTLDAIEMYGRQQTGERCNAPGAVIPIVHVTPGKPPHARVTLRAAPARRTLPRPELRISALRLNDDQLALDITAMVSGDPRATRERLHYLSTLPLADGPTIAATVTLGDESSDLRLPLPLVLGTPDAPPAAAPPMDANIHGDAVTEYATSLAAFPEVTAWIEDHSYQGRPLVALSLSAPTPGRLASPTKAAIFKPAHLIIARHHANEISSTNAAFQLAWRAATDPDWRRLLDHVNVVLLPYENPDGAALHVRLASYPEARTWKHHPARYNALGFEFGEAHFDPETRFGEARARTALWRRWPADVVVDNHGVPSHEWIQPFAGFGSPPRFGGSYWIVQALLYGIVRYVDDPDWPQHQAAAVALRDAVAAIVRDTDIGDWNRTYGESYRFWGQSRLPERFPGEFHDDMLWHISTGLADPTGRGFASRHPKTTVLTWVTEVNDETAEDEHLERVARAHLLANRATLDLMHTAAPPLERTRVDDGDGMFTLRVGRERPLVLGDA